MAGGAVLCDIDKRAYRISFRVDFIGAVCGYRVFLQKGAVWIEQSQQVFSSRGRVRAGHNVRPDYMDRAGCGVCSKTMWRHSGLFQEQEKENINRLKSSNLKTYQRCHCQQLKYSVPKLITYLSHHTKDENI